MQNTSALEKLDATTTSTTQNLRQSPITINFDQFIDRHIPDQPDKNSTTHILNSIENL